MSLWADYLNEREGVHVLEEDWGFAIYEMSGEVCYLRDIYVAPDRRREGLASALADKVVARVKIQGVKVLVGSVAVDARGANDSLKVLLAYGMELANLDAAKRLLYFRKEI